MRDRPFVVCCCVAVLLTMLVVAFCLAREADCYHSPLGGVPVDVHIVGGRPFVCGWRASGYDCVRMVPCQ